MKTIETVAGMRREARLVRARAGRIAFVPTMGYLHDGHLSLLREARRQGDLLVLSIFVNPTQFGPSEDLARYPHDLEGDLAKARSLGTDVVFLPSVEEMYPVGYQTYVEVRSLERGLCGDRRPGHFTGVATVVLKLFHAVEPDLAFFGEKDYQQLQVIRRMTRDLDLDVKVVGLPIVREADGLAMSSRNSYLSTEERREALALSQAMRAARACFDAGEREVARLLAAAQEILVAHPTVRLDYLELRDGETLEPVAARLLRPAVLAVAAFVGRTRLIDNVQLR